MPKIKNISLASILILAMTLVVPIIPKAYSTTGSGIYICLSAPDGTPHRNDAIGPGPQGFLMNSKSPPLSPVPPMVPGPGAAGGMYPWPFAGFIGPVLPDLVCPWSNQGGGGYFGAPPPLFDLYFPCEVWDASGGGPYTIVGVAWTSGLECGCEGDGPNRIFYSWDIDGDGAFETYFRWYARDPGELTVIYETAPVGGIVVPVDKLGLLAPYIGLASTILVATVATSIYAKHVKRRKEKQ